MNVLFQKMLAHWRLVLSLLAAGFVAAVLLMTGGAAALAWTNTEEFCIGCHEMKNNVYAEFKGTIHDQNRTGVRAVCVDCHQPREMGPSILRKLQASKDVYSHFISQSISTPEKFQARRHELATQVWRRMKDTDSLECRNCHNPAKMSAALQSAKAQTRHAKAAADSLTCIDCHFGIAHKEPEGPGPREMLIAGAKKTPVNPALTLKGPTP
ncbi:NapC/NirT family cytochrome c [Rhodoferax ferrireducens]|uniref:NapC/NirT family cytochrome c n=1 Tax=Rhodoferax ferrireducens TaxID=192843 RepID=UPI000E0CE24E|nr:NapC/NirT family cytochrome c [Rhodoferax ferrireducens]